MIVLKNFLYLSEMGQVFQFLATGNQNNNKGFLIFKIREGWGISLQKYISTRWINMVHQLVTAVQEEKGGFISLPHVISSPQ